MPLSSRLAFLSCLCLGSVAPHVQACASLADRPVEIAEESAIIVWDAKNKTEHFIRRATFDTKAKDVGFLVPTPNTPQLKAADDAAFSRLEDTMKPEKIERDNWVYNFMPLILYPFNRVQHVFNTAGASLSTAAGGAVEVVASQRVAGYDTTVLKATDVRALNTWLKRHGYVSSPALMEWLRPYIAKKWKVTAFKIARAEANAPVASSAVRMSFATDKPFFPYREPKQAKKAAHEYSYRLLRVFFLSNERTKGNLGSERGASWPGRVAWASEIKETSRAPLAKQLALGSEVVKARPWMTVFEDHSSSRLSREDVFFTPSPDQKRIVPPPHITYNRVNVPLPADLMLLALCGGVWAGVAIIKRRK